MIIPMKKISIRGPRAELKNTIDVLKSGGMFEISHSKKNASTDSISTPREGLLDSAERVKTVLEFIKTAMYELGANDRDTGTKKKTKAIVASLAATHEIVYTELKDIVTHEPKALELINIIETAKTKHFEIKASVARNAAAIKELAPYLELDIAFNALADTEHTFVLTGIIAPGNFDQFKSDLDLSHIKCVQYGGSKTKSVVVLIGHQEDYVIAHEIFAYGFERCKFNYNATALQKTKEYEAISNDLNAQKADNLRKCLIDHKDLMLLKTYYDYLNNELDTEEISCSALQGEGFFVINGWIVGNEEETILTALKKISPDMNIKTSAPTETDTPPALVKNNPVIAPYESITNLYSRPGIKDIDPNLFVALFYFIFFGVMIGDMGYGILMSAIAFAVILFLKPQKKGTRDLILIIGMCGISTILWGLFLGSFFGFSTSDGLLGKILPSGAIDPIRDALAFLGLALGLGVAQILFGILLKFCNLIHQKKYMDAIFDVLPRIALFIGLIMFVLNMLFNGPATVGTVGIYITIAAVVLIALGGTRKKKGFGKIAGIIGGLYSLVNYFSDIVSYARLFALGLVGAVIASVANTMGSMLLPIPVLGIPLAILVALVFHTFNLALGLLGAYVHNARLQFIEFFGKFYQGGGKQFVPMGSGLKYTKIKEVK